MCLKLTIKTLVQRLDTFITVLLFLIIFLDGGKIEQKSRKKLIQNSQNKKLLT